jgi:hypothetical protein
MARHPSFKFGSFVIRVSSCMFPTTEEPCLPPSCSNFSICYPPGRTLARVAYDPARTQPAELKKLLREIAALGLEVEVVVGSDRKQPEAATEALQRALG